MSDETQQPKLLNGGVNPSVGKATQWKPGQTGNALGRPKRKLLSDALKDALERINETGDKSHAEMIAEAMVTEAITGNVQAAALVRDTTEGRPKQAIDLNGNINHNGAGRLAELLERATARAYSQPDTGGEGGS